MWATMDVIAACCLRLVPEPGETVERAGVRIEILTASDTQVLTTRLSKLALADRDQSE